MAKSLRVLLSTVVVGAMSIAGASVVTTTAAPPASAEDNGVGLTPMMGWSTWGPLGTSPSTALDEQAAQDLASTGLAKLGYDYVDQDDFWYVCPGGQGPDVNANGFWVPNSNFPAGTDGESGIEVLANYVHHLGLKLGLYVTPGISAQAVAENVPILNADGVGDSGYTADEIAATSTSDSSRPGSLTENNYNCGGMVPLATTTNSSGATVLTQGAQDFLDSWADELASWGINYLKLDGVGSFDIPDVVGWSEALRQTGKPIFLALSNSLNIDDASTWAEYANDWRTDGDIQCYCSSASHEETSWSNIESRFGQAAQWAPYGAPGGYNWLDDIVVGDSPAMTGLTQAQSETAMSLWALAASPLEIGVNLGDLTAQGLADLSNAGVISVDQDGIDATRLVNTSTEQIFYKTEKSGDVVVGLFNLSGGPEVLTTTASTLGLRRSTAYELDNLWTNQQTETAGVIEANVPSDGVALFRVTPISNPTDFPPSVVLTLNASTAIPATSPAPVTAYFTDNGAQGVAKVDGGVSAPPSWSVSPRAANLGTVGPGKSAQATFQVTAPVPSSLFGSGTLTATATDTWPAPPAPPGYPPSSPPPPAPPAACPSALSSVPGPQCTQVEYPVVVASPVQAPYETFSSATDAPAVFAEKGTEFGISGGGADVYEGHDNYSTIYLPGSAGSTSSIETEVTSEEGQIGKAGIIVRNNMTDAGSATSPEGVILFEGSGGIQLEWDNDGGEYIDDATPANGTLPASLPVYLMLQRNGDVYTGYYSYDGDNWLEVGSATVPDQASTQDAGMFLTSGDAGVTGTVEFNNFSVSSSATPPSLATFYMANSADFNSSTELETCTTCYYGEDKVGYLGEGGALTFDDVVPPSAGTYNLTIVYGDGSAAAGSPGRPGEVSVNGGTPQSLQFTATGNYTTMGTMTLSVALQAGTNTIEFEDPSAYLPDIDAIVTGFPSVVQSPYGTFSSATDTVAFFRQQGTELGISGAGAGLYSGDDDYSTIYQTASMGSTSTAEVEVTSQENLNGYAKAGIIVRNDMTDAGSTTSPEGVILFESPSGGVQMEWDNDGGEYINDVSPANGTIPDPLTASTLSPVYLMLLRSGGDVYTGYYSTNGTSWSEVASETVPDQASGSQDAGMFVSSGATGDPGTADFSNFSVTAGATAP